MNNIWSQLEMRQGAAEESIRAMLDELRTPLPSDYLTFLRRSNGATGIGPDLFVTLESTERIAKATDECDASQFSPGLIVIGGDGCGNIIGVDSRRGDPNKMEYVVLDPVWLELDSKSCQFRASTLDQVLQYVAAR